MTSITVSWISQPLPLRTNKSHTRREGPIETREDDYRLFASHTMVMCQSTRGSLFASTMLLLSRSIIGLRPLTEIEPSSAELAVFPATLQGALAKSAISVRDAVIHVIGSTAVEDSVDWSLLCLAGAHILLVGPQVSPLAKMVGSPIVPRSRVTEECVTVVRGLYSVAFVRSALGSAHPAAAPDLVIAYNADIYMHYWRRTLAEMLRLHVPAVLSCYCAYEEQEIMQLLDRPAEAFSPSALEEGDAYIRKRYRGDADAHVSDPLGPVSTARALWAFAPNPHAHLPPRDCMPNAAGEYEYGVRNSYWMAFIGADGARRGDGKEEFRDGKEELRDGKEELRDGKEELRDGKEEL